MRVLIFVGLAAVAAAAGFFFYSQSSQSGGEEKSGGLFAEAPPLAPLPTAEDCIVANAVYEYNEDRRLEMRFRPVNTGDMAAHEIDIGGRQIGNMYFVVRATSFQTDYVFAPDNDFMSSGPRYQTTATYLRPQGGGQRFMVSMFDTTMHYINQLPREDSVAPAYIYMPDVMRPLYAERIDLPPGVFRFQRCDQPAAPAATP